MATSDRFWDRMAERYARRQVSDEESYQKKLLETQSYLAPEMRILEFGCGTGTTALQHAPHVHYIEATDISENMLAIGRRNARQAGIENITFTHGSLVDVGADAESLDVVLGLNVIHLLPERETVFCEVARILKPGGLFVSNTICLGDSYLRFLRMIVPLGNLLGMMPNIFVLSEAQLKTEVLNAGFAIERQWHHGPGNISAFMIARKL